MSAQRRKKRSPKGTGRAHRNGATNSKAVRSKRVRRKQMRRGY